MLTHAEFGTEFAYMADPLNPDSTIITDSELPAIQPLTLNQRYQENVRSIQTVAPILQTHVPNSFAAAFDEVVIVSKDRHLEQVLKQSGILNPSLVPVRSIKFL